MSRHIILSPVHFCLGTPSGSHWWNDVWTMWMSTLGWKDMPCCLTPWDFMHFSPYVSIPTSWENALQYFHSFLPLVSLGLNHVSGIVESSSCHPACLWSTKRSSLLCAWAPAPFPGHSGAGVFLAVCLALSTLGRKNQPAGRSRGLFLALPCQTVWPQAVLRLLGRTSSGQWSVRPWRALWGCVGQPSRWKPPVSVTHWRWGCWAVSGRVWIGLSSKGPRAGTRTAGPWTLPCSPQCCAHWPHLAHCQQVAPSGPGLAHLAGTLAGSTCLRLAPALPSPEPALTVLGFLSDCGGYTHQGSNPSSPTLEL